jgi:all-trans-retinol 13,14-reductase
MADSTEVCVVGSGLGGLVLGALLARRGRKVTVLEQHYVPGGCATIFRRDRYRFEVSLHALDGLDDVDPKRPIFEELGLFDDLPLVQVPRTEFYRFAHPDMDVVVPGTIPLAIEVLTRRFPHEREGIRELFETITTIRTELSRLFLMHGPRRYAHMAVAPLRRPTLLRHWNTTVADYLDDLFDDERLKLLLVANTLYYHDDPRDFSLFWYALSQGSFLSGGVHFVKGGSLVLATRLADIIREHGGEVRTNHQVDEILVEDGRASGVRHRKIRGRDQGEGELRADVVVANAPLPVVVNDLVKSPKMARYRDRVNGMKKSCSFLSLYLGLDRSPKALGNPAYSTIVAGRGVERMDDLRAEFASADWSRKGFEFIDYSQIDHGLAPEGKHVGVVSLVDYIGNWADLGEQEYRQQKEEVSDVIVRKLDDLIPGLAASVETRDMSTPKTISRYTSNPDGCIYGFRQDVGQAVPFRLGHRSPVKDLFLASAWVTPGGGFTGAMLSGMACAREVDRALGSSRSRQRAARPGHEPSTDSPTARTPSRS